MEEAISAVLTNHARFQINVHGSRHMLSWARFGEESIEGIIPHGVGRHGHRFFRYYSVRADSVLQTVQLPTRIADLNSGLTDMDTDALALQNKGPE